MKKRLLLFLSVALMVSSCEDMFEPSIENLRGLDDMYEEAEYAQGFLLNGYARIPTNGWSFSDMATDDAVSNNRSNNYLKVATGQWTANNNPFDQWSNSKAAIQYLNILLQEGDKVAWAKDENVSQMFKDRMKGEAYGLRALFMFHLLQNHGGWSQSGELLGVPIVLEPENKDSDFNKPRATFEECMQQIYSDVKKAEELLPLDFEGISDESELPANYSGNMDDYNRVFGQYARQRMTARIAKAVRAQAALLAASPAYNTGNSTTWADAANYAGEVLDLNGGVNGLDPNGSTWYSNVAEIAGLAAGINPREILWRSDVSEDNDLERQHFPPTLYGNGLLNPSQNLVNSFPMANGYPITDASSGFDPSAPYTNRDPRLQRYILVNGGTAGPGNSNIITAVDGTTNDALNRVETSTRTGYYMRKLLRQDVNLNPTTTNRQKHYKPRIRYTELYLAYAEAANEAWGPMGTGAFGFSAYDVIAAIRKRAGIAQPDAYLESVQSDKEAMRALIRNERRLELCFEGFRFWDLRRWNEDLTETARGVRIENENHETIPVEARVYGSYMNYGPLPYSEVLKFDALSQNVGW
ncbi:RagB/SusD family nutrient uptake outer membrane protein [Pontibacter diazotrophicus]|uniref:RagB/SusD family nutrient uptake outer membrane protein n=1 Tax=Pontibacter diazotrophicus TaxID=1400979 RepID=A0A3D8LIC4_9BACT|nr:RagB/SusD family nutrient uptake outer membrane protein [Pontibacter diazotrophicus]RDV17191.1 RagB/SusD family nutrient uptake outer membrane protein [Pontibacter diazotrophicus]